MTKLSKLPLPPFDLAFDLVFLAIENKSIEPLQKLREMLTNREVDVNAWVDEITLLGQVALAGDLQLISLMLNLVGDINFREVERVTTPLMDAARGKNLEIVKLLIDRGADPNIIREGTFALECAAEAGREEIFEFLLPLTDRELHESAKRSMDSVKEKLLRKPLNALTMELFELLGRSDSSKLKIVKAISKGADVNAYDDSDSTILMRACDRFSADIIQLLLKAGADPNLGRPIFRAFRNKNKYYLLDIVKTLIEGGADPNTSTDEGQTILMGASRYNSYIQLKNFKVGYSLCDYLICSGANINQVDQNGLTALMTASDSGDIEIVKLLIERGANPILKDKKGKSALDYATNSYYVKVNEDKELIIFLKTFIDNS